MTDTLDPFSLDRDATPADCEIRMKVLAIDPGPERSAYCLWDGERIRGMGIEPNDELRGLLCDNRGTAAYLAVEMIASYGMPVGREIFETCLWIGRYVEAWQGEWRRVYRQEVKLHLCGSARAKDGNVRQALIDRLGPPGVKAQQGLLYGVKGDEWSALAVALTWWDLHRPNYPALPARPEPVSSGFTCPDCGVLARPTAPGYHGGFPCACWKARALERGGQRKTRRGA